MSSGTDMFREERAEIKKSRIDEVSLAAIRAAKVWITFLDARKTPPTEAEWNLRRELIALGKLWEWEL